MAVDAGADAVGFVFYEKSPRCVTVERAREIVEKLPEEIEKVGVFVGATEETLLATSTDVGLTVAQLYAGQNNQLPTLSDEFLQKVQCNVIFAVPIGTLEASGFFLSSRTCDRLLAALVDSGTPERPGGTGEKFNWGHAMFIREGMKRLGIPLIVAGGLTPENVGHAIDIFGPWGVDVASGVEASPGQKDPEMVRAFVRAVREYDRKVG